MHNQSADIAEQQEKNEFEFLDEDKPIENTQSPALKAAIAGEFYDGDGLNKPEIEASALSAEELERFTDDLIAAFKTVYDPEIPVDIYELGLIYKVDISDERKVDIVMTLTAPGCPVAGEMPGWIEDAARTVPGISDASVELVFDPPWGPERMSDEAKVALNMF
ncbi:MAG: SUF system Fe-S cluster assembly protein [Rhizobiales bacterium]|nr:SUF system Fe-S cluster assembly protein [Hyphomicrobiales bacterium]